MRPRSARITDPSPVEVLKVARTSCAPDRREPLRPRTRAGPLRDLLGTRLGPPLDLFGTSLGPLRDLPRTRFPRPANAQHPFLAQLASPSPRKANPPATARVRGRGHVHC